MGMGVLERGMGMGVWELEYGDEGMGKGEWDLTVH